MSKWLLWSLCIIWILYADYVLTNSRYRRRLNSVQLMSTQTSAVRQNRNGSLSTIKMTRKARDDDKVSSGSTTTESTRSRVLRYMLSNPRIRSVRELFQIIRNTMNVPSLSTSPSQRAGKASKTNATDELSPRQEFANTNATRDDETITATGSNGTEITMTSETAATSSPTSEQASSTPPNGVYFYVDWNSFLNMTTSSGDPINLNFSPKAGNRRLFTPIDATSRLAGSA